MSQPPVTIDNAILCKELRHRTDAAGVDILGAFNVYAVEPNTRTAIDCQLYMTGRLLFGDTSVTIDAFLFRPDGAKNFLGSIACVSTPQVKGRFGFVVPFQQEFFHSGTHEIVLSFEGKVLFRVALLLDELVSPILQSKQVH